MRGLTLPLCCTTGDPSEVAEACQASAAGYREWERVGLGDCRGTEFMSENWLGRQDRRIINKELDVGYGIWIDHA